MTRINRSTADADYARELRAEALAQLGAALFYDDEQASIFTEQETITLARLHYRQRSDLKAALEQGYWAGVSAAAATLDELQQGLQKLEVAELYSE